MLADLLVAVNTDNQNVGQRLRLADGVVVTAVHDVEATIWITYVQGESQRTRTEKYVSDKRDRDSEQAWI